MSPQLDKTRLAIVALVLAQANLVSQQTPTDYTFHATSELVSERHGA
jgi:hypothetical protein